MLPAADWEKLATIIEPEPGPITSQLVSGVPMLLSPHSLGGMLTESAVDTPKGLEEEQESQRFSAELQDLLPDELEDLAEESQEAAAKVLEEGGTVKVR